MEKTDQSEEEDACDGQRDPKAVPIDDLAERRTAMVSFIVCDEVIVQENRETTKILLGKTGEVGAIAQELNYINVARRAVGAVTERWFFIDPDIVVSGLRKRTTDC